MDSLPSRPTYLSSRYAVALSQARKTTPTASADGRWPISQLGRVRRIFWALLAMTIVTAFAVPVGVYYTSTTTSLTARLCLWPAVPAVGAPTRLVILPAPGRDSADTQGPWAQASAQWDMISMEMGQQRTAVSGANTRYGAFVLPLSLQMVGSWRVSVRLQTPGRPLWQENIRFNAMPQPASIHPIATPSLQGLLSYCKAHQRTAVSGLQVAGGTLYASEAQAWQRKGGSL